MRFLLAFALLFLSACGIEEILLLPVSVEEPEEHIEIIIVGPYTQRCHGAFFEQDCLMVREEDSDDWQFFFGGI